MKSALLPARTRRPASLLPAAAVLLMTHWLALPGGDARAEPRQDETAIEDPADSAPEVELPLMVRSKEDKCEEYAKLTDSNPFFCTQYMNERLVEILLLSAKEPEPPPEPRHDRGR